ncbi:DUF2726 domain-containing protein [Vibrio mediterranei]|uniref:DUF2726 domain-containing protein n=1 Tax=Vibrio mediterranei TaxID=689 RepID=A0A3G4VJP3_9VIBR|nr:DUF2726 domain-containing protein [Vibrio mediterranei]
MELIILTAFPFLAVILWLKKSIYYHSRWYKAFNIIAKKYFDFVLCHPNTLAIKNGTGTE